MSKERHLIHILTSIEQYQAHIADMLEAKSLEAKKASHWVCNHYSGLSAASHQDKVKHSLDVHDGVLGVLEAASRMERSLARHLQLLLESEEGEMGDNEGSD
ncbi:hypothetical protein NV379_21220 [Paenibacillus sp. N1-5-1-14]|uniref:hypothetical protein n=1 Tax=Paenibacillus radicibacter TaxID=2972488 RepID=UPI002158F615|nr:hypothetical protein [Paenibacillus radicibacter]MCR8645179.1 hypothetical protein [Paenibacillus radicibacter]